MTNRRERVLGEGSGLGLGSRAVAHSIKPPHELPNSTKLGRIDHENKLDTKLPNSTKLGRIDHREILNKGQIHNNNKLDTD